MRKRLLEIADFLKVSVRSLEVACGLQRGNISNMSEDSAIGSDKLAKIIDSFPYFNAEWILTGNGPMIKDNVDKNTLKPGVEFKYIDKNTDADTNLIDKIAQQAEQIGILKNENEHKNELIKKLNAENEQLKNEVGKLRSNVGERVREKVSKVPHVPERLTEDQALYLS
jgi:NADH dehydrogenase/NADH:ubiquinone oxidoreductase subunit G